MAIRSTPAKPLTCRSTKPGAAIPLPVACQADGLDRPVDDDDVAGEQLAVDQRGFHAQPHPFTAPAVLAVIRCLRASTKTITIGSE